MFPSVSQIIFSVFPTPSRELFDANSKNLQHYSASFSGIILQAKLRLSLVGASLSPILLSTHFRPFLVAQILVATNHILQLCQHLLQFLLFYFRYELSAWMQYANFGLTRNLNNARIVFFSLMTIVLSIRPKVVLALFLLQHIVLKAMYSYG